MTGGSAPFAPGVPAPPKHPAKFSAEILAAIEELLRDHGLHVGAAVLDPFGGIGGIHHFQSHGYRVYAIELEEEWGRQSAQLGPTHIGDFFDFDPTTARFHNGPFQCGTPAQYNAVVTSCTYGNRMADHHEAKDSSTRLTYRHKLGRPLSDNNSGAMQWGDEYRAFHARAWRKVHQLLVPGGLFVLNVKDHVRRGRLQRVPEWHRDRALKLGFELVEDRLVPVRGMGFGANQQDAKVDYEHVYVFRKPAVAP